MHRPVVRWNQFSYLWKISFYWFQCSFIKQSKFRNLNKPITIKLPFKTKLYRYYGFNAFLNVQLLLPKNCKHKLLYNHYFWFSWNQIKGSVFVNPKSRISDPDQYSADCSRSYGWNHKKISQLGSGRFTKLNLVVE